MNTVKKAPFVVATVGFSGGNKYLFPGVAGPEILNFFHWLGAVVTNPMILSIHVSLALSTVALYFALIYTGRKKLKGREKNPRLHFLLGVSALVFRTLTYITSFFTTSQTLP